MAGESGSDVNEVVLSESQIAFLTERGGPGDVVLVIGPDGLVVSARSREPRIPEPATGVSYAAVVRAACAPVLHQVYRSLGGHGRGAVRGAFSVGGAVGNTLLEVERNGADGSMVVVFSEWEQITDPMEPLTAISEDAVVVAVEFDDAAVAACVCALLRENPLVSHLRGDDTTFLHASIDVPTADDARAVLLEQASIEPDGWMAAVRAVATDRGWPSGPTAVVAAVRGIDLLPPDEWFLTVPSPATAAGPPPDLDAEFEDAVSRGALTFLVQPVLDIDRDRIVGGEMLARWTDSRGTLRPPPLGPLRRVDVALHRRLDRLVLDAAIPIVESLVGAGPDIRLHVNVSDDSLTHASTLLDDVAKELTRRRVDSSRMVIEVLEHAGPGPTADVATLRRVAQHGFGLALDDAGAGARLDLLHAVHFDLVKIDAALVAGLPGPRATHIVDGLVALAHGLGADVVAEGIETAVQLDSLRGRGIIAQGHLVSHPLEPADFTASAVRARPVATPI